MKHIILAGAFALVATTAWSGGISDPIVEPAIIIEDAIESAGSDEWVLALMVVLTIGLGITGQ